MADGRACLRSQQSGAEGPVDKVASTGLAGLGYDEVMNIHRIVILVTLVWLALWCPVKPGGALLAQEPEPESAAAIDFDRQIRPILSDRCYFCHGPDEAKREAGLRLDLADAAEYVVSGGDPDASELIRRIESEDPHEVMPPPASKLSVTDQERQLLRRWVQQGAPWKRHWSFSSRLDVVPPALDGEQPVESPIDRFLLQTLESRGLGFREPATDEQLIRRLFFDLTGLPPTLEQIDAFVADSSPDAYPKQVDRLLASPQFGQRMASHWLDVARYSDTYGYQVDRDRFVWPWRDWVVDAFNENLPYDQFMVQQLAGDLLPGADRDQVLATTFNRLHPQKVEGGSVPEEFRVEYVADRAHTMATAFLGLTLECARCHDHKFDPISQREYYQLFAYFNNIDEAGLYSFFTSSVPTPTLTLGSDQQRQQRQALRDQLRQLESAGPPVPEELELDQPVEVPTDAIEAVDFKTVGVGGNQRMTDPRGRAAVELTGDDAVNLTTGNFRRFQPFSVALSIWTPDVKSRAVVFHRSRAWTDAGSRGYQLLIEDGQLSASLIHFWPGNAIRVKTRASIPAQQWLDVAVVYDGSATAEGLSIFIDGIRQPVEVVRDRLTRQITGGGGDNLAIGQRFRDRGFTGGRVAAMSVYDRQLSALEVQAIHRAQQDSTVDSGSDAIAAESTAVEPVVADLQEHYRLRQSDAHREYRQQLLALRKQLAELVDRLPEIMVMEELPEPRPAFVLNRGVYDQRGEPVAMKTPEFLPAMDDQVPANRLGLAQWLVRPDHPLTARVAVNQFWRLLFGRGLVRTPEDFGRQGEPPTHPELLDWLANDFVDHGWDVKRLIRQIVMTRAYRQSSDADESLRKLDPDNRWLARAPSYRWPAEMIRDNALAVSGLLVDRAGGPPVKPYELAASFKPSQPDQGDGLYRRSLYTYWKRTGPAPVMMTLDAAKRDVCAVKRERTSSPLQSLAILNGPQFVEAARALAARWMAAHAEDPSAIARDLFRSTTGRQPRNAERDVLLTLYRNQRDDFQEHPQAAQDYLATGAWTAPDTLDSVELAAWTVVANALLGHHECITKR